MVFFNNCWFFLSANSYLLKQFSILQSYNLPCDCASSRLFAILSTVPQLFNTSTFNGNTRLVTVTVTDTLKRYQNERLEQSQFRTEKRRNSSAPDRKFTRSELLNFKQASSCCVLPRKIRKTLFKLNIWNADNTNRSQKHVPFVSERTKIETGSKVSSKINIKNVSKMRQSNVCFPFLFGHNINGIRGKFLELSAVIKNYYCNVSIINIQETKLKSDICSSSLQLSSFHFFRLDRNAEEVF